MSGSTIAGTTIAVTGAARGLGRAMTLALLQAGGNVAAFDLSTDDPEFRSLQIVADRAGTARRLFIAGCDIRDAVQCESVLSAAADRFGSLDGLINNAGIGMQGFGAVLIGNKPKFYEIEPQDWRLMFETNVNGAFLMARAATRLFLARGRGKIVNVTTSVRTMQVVGFSPYGPTKAALEAATVIWSKDLANSGVTVNALLPGGAANTRMIPEGEIEDRSKLVQPEHMGPPAVWLMSAASDGVTGCRFVASEWDPAIPSDEIAEKLGAPAGWT